MSAQDAYGRAITSAINPNDMSKTDYSCAGMKVTWPTLEGPARALATFDAMAPSDWVFPAQPAPLADITNYQCRAVLMLTPSGTPGVTLFDLADAGIKATGGLALAAWEYANTLSRTGILVEHMVHQMGLTDAQVDALWNSALEISA